MSSAAKKLIGTTALEQAAEGPIDPETVLLLTGDGTDGAQNNTFLDSSSNNHTITRNGNVTQGTFTPFSKEEGKWGVYFDGAAGDYLTAPTSLTDNDFTVEGWLYTSSSAFSYVFVHAPTGSTGSQTFLIYFSSNDFYVQWGSSGANFFTDYTAFQGQWTHFAVTYDQSSETVTGYLDGNSVGTFSATSRSIGPNDSSIGHRDGIDTFDGYISNLRVTNGSVVYSNNFTPPTEPLTAIPGTSLLTCQSNRFVDNSSNNHSITATGAPEVTTFSPFANTSGYDPDVVGGSGYFGGGLDDTNYINIQNLTSIGPSDDFQLEFWTYIEDDSIENWWFDASDGGNRFLLYADANGTTLEWYPVGLNVADPVIKFEWTHICVSRQSGTTRLFKQGKEIGSVSGDTTSFPLTDLFMGYNTGSGSNRIEGYVSDWALTIGSTNKTSDFPVPTIPIGSSGKELYLEFTNAGIIDSSSSNVIETVGNAQIDTTVVKYGTGSMEFDGAGDSLEISNPVIPESGPFTIEFWVYWDNTSAGRPVIISQYSGGSTGRFIIWFDGTLQIIWEGTVIVGVNESVFENTWSHVAFTRDENDNINMFVNGILESTANTTKVVQQIDTIIGDSEVSSTGFKGYIDDLRITKGLARYTTNFTPPGALIEQ